MFNILGTLSSNSAEAFQLGRAEPPHVNRLALFHTVFAPLTVRLSKGREGFGGFEGPGCVRMGGSQVVISS